jgi:hypothetical protein
MAEREYALTVTVQLAPEADPEKVAEALFEFLCADPTNLFPEIEVAFTYDWEAAE